MPPTATNTRAEADLFSFKTVGEAKEFVLAVREHEVVPKGGVRKWLTRREMPGEIAAILMSADAEELVGPVENDQGAFDVYMLNRREDAVLDDSLRDEIRDKLFGELVEAEMTRNPLTFLA